MKWQIDLGFQSHLIYAPDVDDDVAMGGGDDDGNETGAVAEMVAGSPGFPASGSPGFPASGSPGFSTMCLAPQQPVGVELRSRRDCAKERDAKAQLENAAVVELKAANQRKQAQKKKLEKEALAKTSDDVQVASVLRSHTLLQSTLTAHVGPLSPPLGVVLLPFEL